MSAERLRAMLSEATPGPWDQWRDTEFVNDAAGKEVARAENRRFASADARLIALAPDAIALLADAADFLSPLKWDEHPGLAEWQLRLDALTRSEGVTDAVATTQKTLP